MDSPEKHTIGRWITRPRANILLVEDAPAVRSLVEHVLDLKGYDVVAAQNAEEAMEVAAVNKFDLVLLSIAMPVNDGWDTFDRLTHDNPMLPVVVISAEPGQFFTALTSGAGALLEKPLDCQRLLAVIERLLNEPEGERLARMSGKPAAFQYFHGAELAR